MFKIYGVNTTNWKINHLGSTRKKSNKNKTYFLNTSCVSPATALVVDPDNKIFDISFTKLPPANRALNKLQHLGLVSKEDIAKAESTPMKVYRNIQIKYTESNWKNIIDIISGKDDKYISETALDNFKYQIEQAFIKNLVRMKGKVFKQLKMVTRGKLSPPTEEPKNRTIFFSDSVQIYAGKRGEVKEQEEQTLKQREKYLLKNNHANTPSIHLL